MLKKFALLGCLMICANTATQFADDCIEFEIIILSYNNAKWCVQNIKSAVAQDYPHFHITYIDDCSTDGTGELIEGYVCEHKLENLITIIHTKERRGPMANWYYAISATPDRKVVVNLDGDDMLAHSQVLSKLADIYKNYDVWITYGQFKEWPKGGTGWCKAMPPDVIASNTVRYFRDMPSHLRTFYAWLFKVVKKEDFMHEGAFVPMTADRAMLYPMMEMAGERYAFIPEVLYLYNNTNSLSEHRVDVASQLFYSRVIKDKKRYSRLENPTINLRPNKRQYKNNK